MAINNSAVNVCDKTTIKWENEGKKYCVLIQQDDDFPSSPRDDDDGIFTIMATFSKRHRIGDDIGKVDADDFWRDLVRKNVSAKEVYDAVTTGKLKNYRVEKDADNADLINFVELDESGRVEYTYEGIHMDALIDTCAEDFSIMDCKILLHPHAEWLPIWLYDHSGQTISCAECNPFCDPWDSSLIGWIIALKDAAMKATGGVVSVKNAEDSGYHTEKMDDNNWRQYVKDVMQSEVQTYKQWMEGDVYWFKVFEEAENEEDSDPDIPGWKDTDDSCGGFYGSNVRENGMYDSIGYGFDKAIDSGNYEIGEAETKTVCRTIYTF